MSLASSIRDQSGYTLLETLVAMMLFVGVLIPDGAAVGRLMLSDNSDTLLHALRIAQSGICSTIPKDEVAGTSNTVTAGFLLRRDIIVDGNLVTVKVAVASLKKPEKNLVSLRKAFLVQR